MLHSSSETATLTSFSAATVRIDDVAATVARVRTSRSSGLGTQDADAEQELSAHSQVTQRKGYIGTGNNQGSSWRRWSNGNATGL